MYKETKLFKRYNFPSWSMNKQGEVFVINYNSSTWWSSYINDLKACSNIGTGFKIVEYKNGQGIKKVIPNKKAKQIDLLDGENYQIRKVDFVKDYLIGS